MFDQSFGNLDSSKNITTTAHDSLDNFELDFDFDEWINGTAALLHPFNELSSVAETAHSGHSSASDAPVKSPDTDGSSPDGTAGAMRRINRFGRTYVCGRPLSINIRKAICELYQSGWKPCAIATALNVTHGCVSKIVKRYQTTGTVEARKIGGSHPRKSLPAVVNAIIKYKTEQPTLRTWELRDRLLTDGLCDSTTLPTTSSINRYDSFLIAVES
uniref:Paired domain-containing protein n=1 Tax=Plectus sambesii TaxID=2011161 RepID=A0A914XE41_9BILA